MTDNEICITLADGTQHIFEERQLLPICIRAIKSTKGRRWPLPPDIFEKFPALKIIRDRISSSRRSGLIEVIDCFLNGPATVASGRDHQVGEELAG